MIFTTIAFSELSIRVYQVAEGHNALWEPVSEYDRCYLRLNYRKMVSQIQDYGSGVESLEFSSDLKIGPDSR